MSSAEEWEGSHKNIWHSGVKPLVCYFTSGFEARSPKRKGKLAEQSGPGV